MAPRTSKAKAQKLRRERKKRDGLVLVPFHLQVLVNLPDATQLLLKAISTDRIVDIRRLLAGCVETCHITNYSLRHEVRGPRLRDGQEVMLLKPLVLTLVQEEYCHEQAVAHIRRLLDIVACTHCFAATTKRRKNGLGIGQVGKGGGGKGVQSDRFGICPPSELARFYEFFSLAHLLPPLQFLRLVAKEEEVLGGGGENAFLVIEVKLCNGKLVTVTACAHGFRSTGKQIVQAHSLVFLLSRLSQAFSKAYKKLLVGFSARNKFGNLPYGFRSNTWIVPPVAAALPSVFPPLPREDESWGGNGGGRGHSKVRPWAQEFAILAKMACGTAEERTIRDKKAFHLQNMFLDVAVGTSTEIIKDGCERGVCTMDGTEIRMRNLVIRLSRDAPDASKKEAAFKFEDKTPLEVAEQNLLRGITAHHSSTVHDAVALGVVVIRHQGHVAVVEAEGLHTVDVDALPDDFDIDDHPDGGANALNVNSLRTLLHTNSSTMVSMDGAHAESEALVHSILQEAITQLHSEGTAPSPCIRVELGVCWVQHLQRQGGTQKKPTTKSACEGKEEKLGKWLPAPPNDAAELELVESDLGLGIPDAQLQLHSRLSKAAFQRLKESNTGLHVKTMAELMHGADKFCEEVALPKLMADFISLELAPVDGRSLCDFMHMRGLQIRSLGRVAELASNLPHMLSLCEHEMIARALKHLLRSVVAVAAFSHLQLAPLIATAFNMVFGKSSKPEITGKGGQVLWEFVKLFVKKRFRWNLTSIRSELRAYALLRGVCQKVGIEIAPRDYHMDSSKPFKSLDVISMIPLYKHVSCSSADGRTLLESCKNALDKGKGDEAISCGTQALLKFVAVCGPYHPTTAGAYSLLAVVLYHTGDYNQATIYQQRALDINERELGLDHPDTIKSYGDLAVFYYRLQHAELAVRYVTRALYLLHLVCGPSHPNTAATYINVAMMEEGLGNVHVSLRFLHEALQCNQRLLGRDHMQTAACYHAMAIVLSMMEAYSLSVQHEQKTLQILEKKLGLDDARAQDSAAWLQYFESKAVEQQEAARRGISKADPSIASKGHLSVTDLLEFINSEAVEKKDQPLVSGPHRTQVKGNASVGCWSAGIEVDAPASKVVGAGGLGMVSGGDIMTNGVSSGCSTPDVTYPVEEDGSLECDVRKVVQLEDSVMLSGEVQEEEGWQSASYKVRSAHGGRRRGGLRGMHATGAGGSRYAASMAAEGGAEHKRTAGALLSGAGNRHLERYSERGHKGKLTPSGRPVSPGGAVGDNGEVHDAASAAGKACVTVAAADVMKSDQSSSTQADIAVENIAPSCTNLPSASDVHRPRLALSYKDAALAAVGAGAVGPGPGTSVSDSSSTDRVPKGPGIDVRSSKLQERGHVMTPGSPVLHQKVVTLDQAELILPQVKVSTSNINPLDSNIAVNILVEDKPVQAAEANVTENTQFAERKLVQLGKTMREVLAGDNGLNKSMSGVENDVGRTGNGQKNGGLDEKAKRNRQEEALNNQSMSKGSRKAGDAPAENGHKVNNMSPEMECSLSSGLPSTKADCNGSSDTNSQSLGSGRKIGDGGPPPVASGNGGQLKQNGQVIQENGLMTTKKLCQMLAAGNGIGALGGASVASAKEISLNGFQGTENASKASGEAFREAETGCRAFGNTDSVTSDGSRMNGDGSAGDGCVLKVLGDKKESVANGPKADWNIKFGRVAESDMYANGNEKLAPCEQEQQSLENSASAVIVSSGNGHNIEGHAAGMDVDNKKHVLIRGTLHCAGNRDKGCLLEGEKSLVFEASIDFNRDGPQDAMKKLSATAPSFTPLCKVGCEVVAAVTPFKAGKSPPLSAVTAWPAANCAAPTAIAVTPIKKGGPPALPTNAGSQAQVVVPGNQVTPASVAPVPSNDRVPKNLGNASASAMSRRLRMNPNALEFIPSSMNPNAAVFVPQAIWQPVPASHVMRGDQVPSSTPPSTEMDAVDRFDRGFGVECGDDGMNSVWKVLPTTSGDVKGRAQEFMLMNEEASQLSAGVS